MTQHEWPRNQWLRLLVALPAAEVIEAAAALAAPYRIEDVALPQSGLGLMRMREAAMNAHFFIGEIPLATAHVELSGEQGVLAQGAASVMADDVELARALAVLDAVLSANLPGADAILPLLRQGADVVATEAENRRKLLAATRVDFALLGQAEEEMEDA